MRIRNALLGAIALSTLPLSAAANPPVPMTNEAAYHIQGYLHDDILAPPYEQCIAEQRGKNTCMLEFITLVDQQFTAAGYSMEQTLLKIQTERIYQINLTRVFGETLTPVYYALNDPEMRQQVINQGIISEQTYQALAGKPTTSSASN